MANDNVDTSEWDCPCEVEDLEEYILEEETNCDVCENEFPNGTTFYGNRDEDWDVCEYCYCGKPIPVGDDEEKLDAEEMQRRMDQVTKIQVQRITEKDNNAEIMQQRMLDPRNFTLLKPGLRIAAYFKDGSGDRSKNVALASVVRLKNQDEVEVTFDNGKAQIIPKTWVTVMDEQDEEYLKNQLAENRTDWSKKVDTPFHLKDIANKEVHKLDDVKCRFNCGFHGLQISVVLHEKKCRRNPRSTLWAGDVVTQGVAVGERGRRIKAKIQPTLKKWGAGHRMWNTMALETRQGIAKFNLDRREWTQDASTQPTPEQDFKPGHHNAPKPVGELLRIKDNSGMSQIDRMNAATMIDNNTFLPVSAHKERAKRKKKKLDFDQPLGKHTGLSASGLLGEDLMMGLGKGFKGGKLHTPGTWNQQYDTDNQY